MDILQTFIILHNDAVKRDMDFLATVYSDSLNRIAFEENNNRILRIHLPNDKWRNFKQ